ncbi:MAG: hypothetical protein IJ634_00610 [Bacteroidales bacterium]|nr:hypothetical protein [Bacteroidales bacterium]
MKKNLFIALAACMTLCGCYFNRDIDETIETDRYTMHITSDGVIAGHDGRFASADTTDSIDTTERTDIKEFTGTIPRMAYHLMCASIADPYSTTMCWIEQDKQPFLPKYVCTVIDSDTTQPDDYTPLLRAMMDRGILRADTTYEPLQLLELYDSARYAQHMSGVDVDSSVLFQVEMEDGEPAYGIFNAISVVAHLRETYRMPLTLAPSLPADLTTEIRWMVDDWSTDSLWLDSMGFRIVPDPQGRQMRIITINRHKGKI